ncbi:MAG: LLM class F420-dependent oxidoreductase [Chloroflexota bacterium]
MKIGLQLPYFNFANTADTIAQIAQTAEAGGVYSMWVMDHFFQLGFEPLGPQEDPMLEGYSVLSYLAGQTETIKLGTLVTGVIYRNPGLLAKVVTTLDVLSKGRAYLGIGAAWFEREAVALGFAFPSVKERFEWLEETLQIAHQMWSDNDGAYAGKHFQLAETLNNPPPMSQPHPPIMIGGMGEKKTLKFVAQYGDACNLFLGAGIDVLSHKIEVLKGHCSDVGRDYDDIEKTTLGTAYHGDLPDSDAVIEICKQLADLGVSHAIFNMPDADKLDNVKRLTDEVVPAVADL